MKTPKLRRNKKTTSVEEKFICSFCNKEFQRENSLLNHACRNKMRYFDKDTLFSRIAFGAYSKFYSMVQKQLKPKTIEEFISSKYYGDFIKFGKYVINNNLMYPEAFSEFCIKNSLPLRDWTKPSIYETYLREINKREEPEIGIERTILLMKQWADETGEEYYNFFRKIEPTLFVHYVRQGRISPWVLYNTDSGKELLQTQLNEEQINLIADWIDPDFWHKKFKLNSKDRDYFKKIFKKEKL